MTTPHVPVPPVLDAVRFAVDCHRDRRRQDGPTPPLVKHPIEVAWWLAFAVTGGALVYGVVLFLAGARPRHLLHRA